MDYEDGYRALAAAIVLQAVNDFRKAARDYNRGRNKKGNIATMTEVIEFINSDWYKCLTDIPPEVVIKKLKEEIEDDE